jgi:hypothetical protein
LLTQNSTFGRILITEALFIVFQIIWGGERKIDFGGGAVAKVGKK